MREKRQGQSKGRAGSKPKIVKSPFVGRCLWVSFFHRPGLLHRGKGWGTKTGQGISGKKTAMPRAGVVLLFAAAVEQQGIGEIER